MSYIGQDVLAYRYHQKHGVLYCSKECAVNDGKTPQKGYKLRPLKSEEFTTEEYGALCPYCESLYHNY